MPADTLVDSEGLWSAARALDYSQELSNANFLIVRLFFTLSRYFLLSQLVQQIREHNRNLIISIRIISSADSYGDRYKLQASPGCPKPKKGWRSLPYSLMDERGPCQ
jgi:hypothetical protein